MLLVRLCLYDCALALSESGTFPVGLLTDETVERINVMEFEPSQIRFLPSPDGSFPEGYI